MVMFTCVKVGCVGGNAEGEVAPEEEYDAAGEIQREIQPAQTSLEFRLPTKLNWRGGAPGKSGLRIRKGN